MSNYSKPSISHGYKWSIRTVMGLGLLSVIVYGGHQVSSWQDRSHLSKQQLQPLMTQELTPELEASMPDVELPTVSSAEASTGETESIKNASPTRLSESKNALTHGDDAAEMLVSNPGSSQQYHPLSTKAPTNVPTKPLTDFNNSVDLSAIASSTIAPHTMPNRTIEATIHNAIPGLMACSSARGESDAAEPSTAIEEVSLEQHYLYYPVNLDGEEGEEMIVSVFGPMTCGTGGCTSLILKTRESNSLSMSSPEYDVVSQISLVNGSMIVSDRTTAGWKDLLVMVSGGGIYPGYRRLQFDGRLYPRNPSLEPIAKQGAEQDGLLLMMDEETVQETAPLLSPPLCDR